MEEPPPPPPKDPAYASRMDVDRPPTAPSSGSKRKRTVDSDEYHFQHSEVENVDPDAHTPKRNRSAPNTSADEDGTPVQHRSIRRKKGMRGLSNLNLRHAASQQVHNRDSKFQEGSLTDKPSLKPPSLFTKMPRSESDNSLKVDEMMEDYHDDVTVPRYSTTKPQHSHPRAHVNMETYKNPSGNGFFHFGRQIAASFNPASLWQRWWAEPKEDASQNSEDAEEKAKQKAEAEAKYAEVKKAGQFKFHTVNRRNASVISIAEDLQTPRDSAIEIDSLQNTRSSIGLSSLLPPTDDTGSRSGSEVPGAASKQNKTLKSRLHLKKPSLSNIKDDLKRVRSDLSLGASARQRESSSSVSPVKQDFDSSALKRSQSRYDLKKAHKLSKRVSDLEAKLESAKKELDVALFDASPAPNLTNKYPTFKPSGTFKRNRFVPGKLPSLPSERILMAEQMKSIRGDGESEDEPSKPRKALHPNSNHTDDKTNDNEDTVKASRGRPYPTRASTLFNLDNDHIDNTPTDEQSLNVQQALEITPPSTKATDDMDPNSITNGNNDGAPNQIETAGYNSLDAKLKALEKNVKVAEKVKQAKPKKRKSNGDDDRLFRPGKESDDDAEWEEATPKKKRKSGGNKNESSPKHQEANGAPKKASPPSEKTKAARKTNGASMNLVSEVAAQQIDLRDQVTSDANEDEDQYSEDEAAFDKEDTRTSLDSQDRTLAPVYEDEEDEDVVITQVKPAAKAVAPAAPRFHMRSRSNSPSKRAPTTHAGVEEQMLTRAAEAAKKHRSVSPPPVNGVNGDIGLAISEETEVMKVKPGANGVPKLPKGANGSFESLDELEVIEEDVEVLSAKDKKASFEWPEDVF